MVDPLAKVRQTACTRLTDVYGDWAFKPSLRGVDARDGAPPADVFQRSLDDRTLLSARFEDGRVFIELLDVTDGRLRACIERSAALPYALCWDASGDTLLLANRDARERMTLEIYSLSTGSQRVLDVGSDVRFVALLAEGRYAVVSDVSRGAPITRVYNLERGAVLRTWPRVIADMSPGAIALSQVASGALRWCPLDGETLGVISDAPEHRLRARAAMALHPDEATFASIDRDGNVFCADESGALRWSVPWPLPMEDWDDASLRWCDRGDTLCAASGHGFAMLRGRDGHYGVIARGRIAPSARDNSALFARPVGILSDLRDPDAPLGAGHRNAIAHVGVSSDGALLATSASDTLLRVWASGAELWSSMEGRVVLAFADDQTLLSCDRFGVIKVWNARTGETTRSITIHTGFKELRDLSVSRDGRLALVTGTDLARSGASVLAVDLATGLGRWRASVPHALRARLVEGSREVTVSRAQGFVSQLSLSDGALLDDARVFADFVRADGDFYFLHGGQRALCLGGDGWPLRLIDMLSGRVRWERADPGSDPSTVAVSDDGRWFALALAGSMKGVIQLRSAESGAIVDQIDLRSLHDRPGCMVFSHNARVLCLGTMRGVALRFDCSALG